MKTTKNPEMKLLAHIVEAHKQYGFTATSLKDVEGYQLEQLHKLVELGYLEKAGKGYQVTNEGISVII